MNFILFGPPGVGKSTLVGTLKTLGARAIDLEDVYPSRVRFTLPNNVDDVFFGAADLDPKRNYHNAKKILLYLPQEAYSARRSARDQAVPGKSSQREHRIDDWLENTEYDWVMDVSPDPRTTALKLLEWKKGGSSAHK